MKLQLYLQARDMFGNAQRWSQLTGGDPFRAVLAPDTPGLGQTDPGAIRDFENGTYLVELRSITAAFYRGRITLKEETLPGSDGVICSARARN